MAWKNTKSILRRDALKEYTCHSETNEGLLRAITRRPRRSPGTFAFPLFSTLSVLLGTVPETPLIHPDFARYPRDTATIMNGDYPCMCVRVRPLPWLSLTIKVR